MPQDLTASTLFRMQMVADQMLAGGGVPSIDLDPNLNQAFTVAALMERQQARAQALYDPRGTCRGVQIHHIDGAWTPDATDVSSGFAGEECDLDVGNDPESVATQYNHNLFVQEGFQISDKECDNIFNNPDANGIDRIAAIVGPRLAVAMKNTRRKLNAQAIAFLAANASPVNRDVNMPTHITHAGTTFSVNKAGFFQDPTSLTDIDAVVSNNDMGGVFLISGRNNHYNAVIDSRYFRLDDDKRNVSRWSVDMLAGANLYFDINRLDSELTGANTFVIMPQSYAMWNVQLFDAAPRLVDASRNLYEYSIIDPQLSIVDNGVFRPVYYNVLYQFTCDGTDRNGRNVFTHKWLLRYLGGLAPSPTATDNHTGILRFADAFAPGI
jgi:hypothetical protein